MLESSPRRKHLAASDRRRSIDTATSYKLQATSYKPPQIVTHCDTLGAPYVPRDNRRNTKLFYILSIIKGTI
jgi:hypothetical protein